MLLEYLLANRLPMLVSCGLHTMLPLFLLPIWHMLLIQNVLLPPFWKSPFPYVLTLVFYPNWMGSELVFILYCIVHSPQPDYCITCSLQPDCSVLYAACSLTCIDLESMAIQRGTVFLEWEAGLPEMYIRQPCSAPIIITYLLHTLHILTSLKSPLASLSDIPYQKECLGP